MIRRRVAASNTDSGLDDAKFKKRISRDSSKAILSGKTVAALVIGIITIAYLQHHYNAVRSNDPFLSPVARISKQSNHKKSLLTAQQDADLVVDKNTGLTYHVIFSTDCSPYQHWQSYLVYYTAMKVKQTGHVTRIASGCDPQQAKAMEDWFNAEIAFMSQRFHLQLTPEFSNVKNEKGETVGDYKFFNKPFGLKYWLEHSPQIYWDADKGFPETVKNDIVMLIDPDMGLLRPLTADFSDERETLISPFRKEHLVTKLVGPGKPAAQVYGFGTQWARLDLAKIAGKDSPAIQVSQEEGLLYYPVGPPYIGTVPDMHKIAKSWTAFVHGTFEQYPHLLAEMFAFCIAAAHEKLPFQLIDSLMISKTDLSGREGWPLVDKIPREEVCGFAKDPDHHKYAVPSVVHLCQRYSVGSDWFFSKRKVPSDVYDCSVPLLEEPPDDLAVKFDYRQPPGGHKTTLSPEMVGREAFMICYLHRIINDAATFYKTNACSAPNLDKKRSLVALFKRHQTDKEET